MENTFTRYYVWEETKACGLRQLGNAEGYPTLDKAEKQVKALTEAWDNATRYLKITSPSPPNYPSCRYCGKFFETAWHVAVHQWNCRELNQATKRPGRRYYRVNLLKSHLT